MWQETYPFEKRHMNKAVYSRVPVSLDHTCARNRGEQTVTGRHGRRTAVSVQRHRLVPVWVMSHVNESCQTWMSHVTSEWVMSHVNESCHTWMSHVSHMNAGCHVWIAASPGGGEGWEEGGGTGEFASPTCSYLRYQKVRPKGHECTKRNVCIPKETTKKSSFADGFLGAEVRNMCRKRRICQKRRIHAKRDLCVVQETYQKVVFRGWICWGRDTKYVSKEMHIRQKRLIYTKRNLPKSHLSWMNFLGLNYKTCVKRDVYMPKETYIYQKSYQKVVFCGGEMWGTGTPRMSKETCIQQKRPTKGTYTFERVMPGWVMSHTLYTKDCYFPTKETYKERPLLCWQIQ